jgi:hypothetical protein
MHLKLSLVLFLLAPLLTLTPTANADDSLPPSAVPTFHCLSIYWSPAGGDANKKVLVQFREKNAPAAQWRDALPMRYNPVKTPECKGDYRGSIVNLTPNTAYDINLTLEGTDTKTSLTATTWNENFPIASTVKVASQNKTVTIDKSGTADGYILYDGTGATIDTNNQSDLGIAVDASYVILRGFTIKNVKQHGIRINSGHHIVIENCDISKWGSEEEKGFGVDSQAAVYSHKRDLHNVVIQRNKFHNPSWDSNSWAEEHNKSRHPAGPQTIVFWEAEGNNVIRYNELYTDKDHYYNDVLGGGENGSYRGFPGADSDIYCNYIEGCWDDGIESEGGNQNVRIWNNYIENTMIAIANAATSIGPLYVWRNVCGKSYSPPGSSWDLTHGPFMKMGFAGKEDWMTGHMYIFNNTLLQPDDQGYDALGGSSRAIKHCTTRNNIFQVRSKDTHAISTDKRNTDNDFDYDLIDSKRIPPNAEPHGLHDKPIYFEGAGFNEDTKTGNFQQAPGTAGIDAGVVIPNFADTYTGKAPDLGAQEAGTPNMTFGTQADFIPSPPPTK